MLGTLESGIMTTPGCDGIVMIDETGKLDGSVDKATTAG
jgi:sensor domain CHASE-containing protein